MMDTTHTYWEENSNIMQRNIKFERSLNIDESSIRTKDERANNNNIYQCCDPNLNFSTATCSEDDCEYGPYKKNNNKVARQDPMSHRIIEKRRRDRMNNCLADLSRLIPTEYLKKGRGRIEKTEIIEMAIKHMKHLQVQERTTSPVEHYRLGYQECMSEAVRFMVEVEGHFPREPICVRLLNHLEKHCEELAKNTTTNSFSDSPTHHHHHHDDHPSSSDIEQTIPSFSSSSSSVFLRSSSDPVKISEFSMPKAEPENSNSNDTHPGAFNVKTSTSSEDYLDKEHHPHNIGMSYKYKTNIKLRFNQDLNAHEVPKRQKLTDNGRRNSITIYENQSSNQSSPPSSETCTRISESENNLHLHTPPSSDTPILISPNNKLIEGPKNDTIQRFSPTVIIANNIPNEKNFNVPIFVLHTKGSYYIPLSIDYKTLMPFLQNLNIIDPLPQANNLILHPVTINVNFMNSPSINNNNNNNNNNNKFMHECNNNWH